MANALPESKDSNKVGPPGRFFIQEKVIVKDVRAKFRNAGELETGHFFSLHDPKRPTFRVLIDFGCCGTNYEKDCLSVRIYPRKRLTLFTKIRIDVFTLNGERLASRYNFNVSKPRDAFENYGFKNFLKSEKTKGVDTLNILIQFEYEECATVSTPSPVIFPSALQDYSNLFESGDHSDFTFLVENEKIKGHKAIVAARCSYFARMFQGNMQETISNEVKVDDVRPEIFREMLKFIYCGAKPKCLVETKNAEPKDGGTVDADAAFPPANNTAGADDADTDDNDTDDDTADNDDDEPKYFVPVDAMDLLAASDKYGVDELKKMSEVFLCDHLNPTYVIECLILAHLHNCVNLMQQAAIVYRMCSIDLKKEDERKKLEKYPGLFLKLLDSYDG